MFLMAKISEGCFRGNLETDELRNAKIGKHIGLCKSLEKLF
jgi:hypothetical protein